VRRNLVGDLADQRVGHGQNDGISTAQCRINTHTVDAGFVLEALLTCGAGLYMSNRKLGTFLEIFRQANAHLSASSE